MLNIDNAENKVSIFDFTSFSTYFSSYLAHSKKTRKTFSLRQMCRQTGIKSPAMFTWLANGTRLPTTEVLERLNSVMAWSPAEHAYAQLLVNYEKTESSLEKSHILEQMRSVALPKHVKTIQGHPTKVFLKWYIMAIFEMTRLKDFRWDPEWIAHRLGGRVLVDDIQKAINTLVECNFLTKVDEGQWKKNSESQRTQDGVVTAAVRTWHSDMMKLAQRAVHLQPPSERFFSGVTLTIDGTKVQQASELLAEFREKFIRLMQVEKGTETYQFSMQFFRLTENKIEPNSSDDLDDNGDSSASSSAKIKEAG